MTKHLELTDSTPMSDTEELLRSVSERPPSDAPYLAESTARYILNQSSQNETANERDIENALSALPLRLTRLLYDIAILSRGDYLDNLDENWKYLDEVPDVLSYASRYSHGRETASNRDDFHFNLGFDVGLGLSALTGTISEDSRASEFLAGFTTAYSTDHFQRAHKTNNRESDDEIEAERKQLLEQYGIEPTTYLDQLIQYHNLAWSDIKGREPLTPKEATQEYLEQRVGDWFGKCSYLRAELEREWDSIGDASVPGMDAEEVLRALWELKFYENSDDSEGSRTDSDKSTKIAKKAGKNPEYKGQVSHVLNQLSIEGKEPSVEVIRTFEGKEIVQYDGDEWELTDYGQLLLYHVFGKKRDPAWIQETAIGKPLPADEVRRYTKKDSQILAKGANDYYDD